MADPAKSPTIRLAREQGYREGYAQAKAEMQREIGVLLRLYSNTDQRLPPSGMTLRDTQIAVLVHVRTVLRALTNRRLRRG